MRVLTEEQKARQRAYYHENKERISEYRKEWARAHKKPRKPLTPEQKTRQRQYQKVWHEENRERTRLVAKARRDREPEKARTQREASREKRKDYALRWHYGISLSEYNALRDAQRGTCAIWHTSRASVSTGVGQIRSM